MNAPQSWSEAPTSAYPDVGHSELTSVFANLRRRAALREQPTAADWYLHGCTATRTAREETFPDVDRADVFSVHAADEREAADLTRNERAVAGVDREWEPTEDPEGGRWLYFVDGTEIEPTERVLVPVNDPVPHYDHGHINPAKEAV